MKYDKLVIFAFVAVLALVYLVEIRILVGFLIKKVRGKPLERRFFRGWRMVFHSLAVIGVLCFLYGYFIEPYRLEIKTVTIPTEKLTDSSFRIVQISDLHCDRKPRNERRLVERINALEPDVIVFTGDALNTVEALGRFKSTLKNLHAKLGKFAVRGNIDCWYWRDVDLFGGTDFQQMLRERVVVRKEVEHITISGLDFEREADCKELLQGLLGQDYNVFLYHNSSFIEDLDGLDVDLYLAGHTHGGQVALPFYGALITLSKYGKKYEAGMYRVGDTILYVNRGIGMEGGRAPRVRFFARPEITVFDIIPKK